jgi:hypothetical protein
MVWPCVTPSTTTADAPMNLAVVSRAKATPVSLANRIYADFLETRWWRGSIAGDAHVSLMFFPSLGASKLVLLRHDFYNNVMHRERALGYALKNSLPSLDRIPKGVAREKTAGCGCRSCLLFTWRGEWAKLS